MSNLDFSKNSEDGVETCLLKVDQESQHLNNQTISDELQNDVLSVIFPPKIKIEEGQLDLNKLSSTIKMECSLSEPNLGEMLFSVATSPICTEHACASNDDDPGPVCTEHSCASNKDDDNPGPVCTEHSCASNKDY